MTPELASPPGQPGPPDLVPVAGGTAPHQVTLLVDALRTVLADGAAPVLVPHAPSRPGSQVVTELRARLQVPLPAGTAAVLQTSGSTTGRGHLVALTADALTASARATHERLAGPGRWLLAVPAHHVAGLQVLVRSLVAGTAPVVLDTSAGFDPGALAAAAAAMGDDAPGYLSLVPTQLVRVLDAGEAATAPLRRLAAILVGGAASGRRTLQRARDAGLRVVTTYGMTETGGGCVYDGVPLPGVRLRLTEDDRVELSGPMLAAGYLDDAAADAAAFRTEPGGRWLRTSDRGHLEDRDGAQRLTVLGRVDEVLNTGGVKVSPTAVERVLSEHDSVGEVVVVGVPDAEWGQLVTAVVAPVPGRPVPGLSELRAAVRARLGGAHAPRAVVVLDHLPARGPGKVDRIGAARLAAAALAEPGLALVERHGGSTAQA
ncbi:AMP-binding protein [Georgenia yuyongxinii]|uniref:AMP-binding protein n=1 Tax=Georgenia yuyongxinii TaxID=2589797 RepID=A0A5B8C6A6_9MICO|nr:o-succinylbenzoate--CoA ligase [Georgenia yuyongxinii]QDC25964.1 AMP-binding protein [Georgenia yuyongxinii]